MSSQFTLRVPGYRPFLAKLIGNGVEVTQVGEVEHWEVTGPSAGTCSVQSVANAMVTVMGARGRSMRDVYVSQDRRAASPNMVIGLQLGDPNHREGC